VKFPLSDSPFFFNFGFSVRESVVGHANSDQTRQTAPR